MSLISVATKRCLTVTAVGLLLAACAGPAQAPDGQEVQTASRAHFAGSARSDALLYVANSAIRSSGSVVVYDTKAGKLLRTITDGVNEPEALAVDPAGNLYVANRETKNITAYAPGSTTVSFTIANVAKVRAMQFDPAGELNVAGSDDVTVYAAGTGQLLRTIKNKLHHPYRLTFDPAGDLFVLSFDVKPRKTDIVEFAPGATKATRYFGVSQYANCLVVGPDGYLYVGNDTTVLVIDPATGATVRTISDGVYDALTVAFDSVGNFYLSNNGAGNGIISVYAPGASAPMYEIKQDDAYSFALLFDAKNNLYVASQYGGQSNYGMVAEFASGQTSPKRIIQDGMMYPNAAAFGPK